MKTKLVFAAVAAIALSSCATIVKGEDQTLMVKTSGVDSATCNMTGGSEFAVNETFTTPAEVTVPRSGKDLKIDCRGSGLTGMKTVDSSIEPWTAGNLLFGGLIGIGVDAYTGAVHKYDTDITVNMLRAGATSTVTGEPIS